MGINTNETSPFVEDGTSWKLGGRKKSYKQEQMEEEMLR
jgi:hypothetical protein